MVEKMVDDFSNQLLTGKVENPQGNIFDGIMGGYQKIVMHSLLTAFGLDFIKDLDGGDVDTIRGVRMTDKPIEERYKNTTNKEAYLNNTSYDAALYHNDPSFRAIKHEGRNEFNVNGTMVEDAYVPGNMLAFNKAAGVYNNANLEHIIAAKEINDDPGRVLAGLYGVALANSEDNLVFVNEHLNKAKGSLDAKEFVQKKGEELSPEVQNKILEEDKHAREAYEKKLFDAYYSSDNFLKDTLSAAVHLGIQMGARQAIGMALVELFFACKTELKQLPNNSGIEAILDALITGIKNGAENIKKNSGEILDKFCEGFISGLFASLTSTLINIFFETKKNTIRNIRNAYASVTEAGTVILFNPDDLLLGDRIRTCSVILASGASVIVGSVVGDELRKVPLPLSNREMESIARGVSALVSGLLSCTFLVILDRSTFINDLIDKMNQYLTTGQDIKRIANIFNEEAAFISKVDIATFSEETNKYHSLVTNLPDVDNDDEISRWLQNMYEVLTIQRPYNGSIDDFMNDDDAVLIF